MQLHPKNSIAVIFCARRTGTGDEAYHAAALAMGALAAQQPGYLGEDHARSADGFGITVSYWRDDASAKAWRDHPEHADIRDQGRDKWYRDYSLHVARVERGYDWQK
ncbi:antibiotic biosynthesis monooxygenase [Parasphingorhabdus sp.]|jgi:heme-degrading monooxygenase HmoA|uniref:antibiotic biosynthesis monooxygenase family protein n=1 Tax=Parasphingorhabdus sp. TaxID=2709688 RepID=UPI0030AF24C7|nr:antibiotic biosynthesis monooxygenase [Sphingomonadales bacterium]